MTDEKKTTQNQLLDSGVINSKEKTASTKGPAFRVAEAYRLIRTNMLFTLANSENRAVVFTSAEPSAGKSTISSNLAVVMAQTGAKVLLIDADMRRPTQHRSFRVGKSMGLSRILGGLDTLDNCTSRQVYPNLDLIPSGPLPPNPSELLGSARMKTLLEELQEKYDYIFIDTPPVNIVTDALVIAPQTAGVVLVARQKQTTYDDLMEAAESIKQIKAAFLGTILTDMRQNINPYRYTKKYYYRNYNYEYTNSK